MARAQLLNDGFSFATWLTCSGFFPRALSHCIAPLAVARGEGTTRAPRARKGGKPLHYGPSTVPVRTIMYIDSVVVQPAGGAGGRISVILTPGIDCMQERDQASQEG